MFAHTAAAISQASDEASAPASLAQIILQDASLTSHVLRLANSAYYSSGNEALNTISRAIIVLGFVRIRSICLSVATVDALSNNGSRDEVEATMSASFHAAILAELLAELTHDESPEEVFVAALLYRIGELAFWCFAERERLLLLQSQAAGEIEKGRAETQVLGFRLRQLSAELVREWKLSPLLQDSFRRGVATTSSRSQLIVLGHRLAESALLGWESEEFKEVLKCAAHRCAMSEDALLPLIWTASETARERAEDFGSVLVSSRIPQAPDPEPVEAMDCASTLESEETSSLSAKETSASAACPLQQLRLLREIAMQIEECGNRISLITMILEGVYRGVSLERVAYVAIEGAELLPSFSLGCRIGDFSMEFWQALYTSLKVEPAVRVSEPRCEWIKDSESGFPPSPTAEPYFFATVVEDGRISGIIYGDRGAAAEALDEDCFAAFKHFALQATHGLQYLRTR